MAVPALAREIEADDSRRTTQYFLATLLLRGTNPDQGGGWARLMYNPYSNYLTYLMTQRTYPERYVWFQLAGGLLDQPWGKNWFGPGNKEIANNTSAPDLPVITRRSTTTSLLATCQVAKGLVLCSEWNGLSVGTCYALSEFDYRAAQEMQQFGGGGCAREWACASIATCYFSSQPEHWCAWTNKSVCYSAYTACGVTHVPVPDFRTSTQPSPLQLDLLAPSTLIDPETPASARTATLGGQTLTLVLSDEFNTDGRSFAPGRDRKWEAVEAHDSDTTHDVTYTPESVTTEGGAAVITLQRNLTYDLQNQPKNYRSGMLQSWNKFCMTGGYIEVNVKQAGNVNSTGLYSVFNVVGNLARIGYPTSFSSWPWTYSTCDTVAASGQSSWANNTSIGPQPLSACQDFSSQYGFTPYVGRGSPSVDVFRVDVPTNGWNTELGVGATVASSLNMAPKIPPNTLHGAGLTGDCWSNTAPCTGIEFNRDTDHHTQLNPWCMFNTTAMGGNYMDCIGGLSGIYSTHFSTFHKYGLMWEPDQYMAWYIDGVQVFKITRDALTNKANPNNASQAVGQRQIPTEPMYLNFALWVNSQTQKPLTPDVANSPQTLEIDYVRVYQNTATQTLTCNPTAMPTSTYIEKNLLNYGVPQCGNGICDSGECDTCPADCQEVISCRQSCSIPQCQVRDPTFQLTGGFENWALFVLDPSVSATVDWTFGVPGMTVNIVRGGWESRQLQIVQGGIRLCESFRYRATVTASSPLGVGSLWLDVTGGVENGYASVLPKVFSRVLILGQNSATLSLEFEVSQRWTGATMTILLGGFESTLGKHSVLIDEATLCPVPSSFQRCDPAPRQTPNSALENLLGGHSALWAFDQLNGVSTFGELNFLRTELPTHSIPMGADLLHGQVETDITGHIYFWTKQVTSGGTNNGSWIAEFVVLHSSPWFQDELAIQAITLHFRSRDSLPSMANVFLPLYCNVDIPQKRCKINCAAWNNTVVSGSERKQPNEYFTNTSFQSTGYIDPQSVEFQTLLPLSGKILLSESDFKLFDDGMIYAVLWTEDAPGEYGRIRGSVIKSYQPSAVGGIVFEWMDEWWKGDKADVYHEMCNFDNESTHSTCGFELPGFGPDSRLNEEWFGMYEPIYDYESNSERTKLFKLQPRPAVQKLQDVFSRSSPTTTLNVTHSDSRRARQSVPMVPRAAVTTPPGSFDVVLPSTLGDYLNNFFWLGVCAVLIIVMVGVVFILYLFAKQHRYVRREEPKEDDMSVLFDRSPLDNINVLNNVDDTSPSAGQEKQKLISEYQRMTRYVERFTRHTWKQVSDGYNMDYLIHVDILPMLQRLDQQGRTATIPLLEDFLDWLHRYAERHDRLESVLANYATLIRVSDEGNVTLTPLGRQHPSGLQGYKDAPPGLVDWDSSKFVIKAYMNHVRTQLSRNARMEDCTLNWYVDLGYESAFDIFDRAAMEQACKRLFQLVCPSDILSGGWVPPDSLGEHGYYPYVTCTLLFLVVQQYAENMRQAPSFKKRVWQYLASALPDFQAHALDWDSTRAECWGDFNCRARSCCILLRYLLTMVDRDTINFADVDETFEQTIVRAPCGAWTHKIPNYLAADDPAKKTGRISWFVAKRKPPTVCDFEQLLPTLSSDKSQDTQLRGVYKTYAELVTPLGVLRTFFFAFHYHLVLFVVCLFLNSGQIEVMMYVLCGCEAATAVLRFFSTALLLQGWNPIPAVTDLLQVCLGVGWLVLTFYDMLQVNDDLLQGSFATATNKYVTSTRHEQVRYLFGLAWLNYTFLGLMWGLLVIRELGRLAWKFYVGYWGTANWGRMFILATIAILDFGVGYFFLLPAVSSLSFKLCDCNNTVSACTWQDPNILCYPATFIFFFIIYLSYMMVTALLWMLVSLVWSFFMALLTSVGSVRVWATMQQAMDTNHLEMILYSPWLVWNARKADGSRKAKNSLFSNLVVASLQHWIHSWHRDLISVRMLRDAKKWKFKSAPESLDALVISLTQINGHQSLWRFVYGEKFFLLNEHHDVAALPGVNKRKRIPACLQSIFSMRSVTFFCPVYAETIIYSVGNLQANGVLYHFIDLYHDEWQNFNQRVFWGLPTRKILTAFFTNDYSLATLWVQERHKMMQRVEQRLKAWPPTGDNAKHWPKTVTGYDSSWGYHYFPDDPPPSILPGWLPQMPLSKEDEVLLKKIQFWCMSQIRWWCTLRGQTLGRTLYGLMEMREALVDSTFLELKALHHLVFVNVDYHLPNWRSRYDEILAWILRNRYHLFSIYAGCGPWEMKYVSGELALHNFLDKPKALACVVIAEVAMACFLDYYKHHVKTEPHTPAYHLLRNRTPEGLYVLPCMIFAKCRPHMVALSSFIGGDFEELLIQALQRLTNSLEDMELANLMRAKADQVVAEKFQVCIGAQVYEQQKETYLEINEVLATWKMRHVQFMSAKDGEIDPRSFWLQRRDPFTSQHVHAYSFATQIGGAVVFDSNQLETYVTKTKLQRTWHRLKIGEGKAENQNNMINALLGEVVNILDMNQDGYYSEGLKLPLVIPQFQDSAKLQPDKVLTKQQKMVQGLTQAQSVKTGKQAKHATRRNMVLGGDDCGILGFREHVFTTKHSAIGRYMALAEHAFGTLVQRFLTSPHHIRMHYGHPDMTNGFLMKKTAGVSRGCLRVNVNEDIFLGYEMVSQGVNIAFTETLFYGKGRDVEFNAASVFLKKLAQGCVMQLASRQVCDLYLVHLTIFQKIALFLGTLNHFMVIVIADTSIFLFTWCFVLYQVAQISAGQLYLNGSKAGNPWIFQLGFLNVLPMLVERKIEFTYLSWTDVIYSMPFFSHQNRITAELFHVALRTQKGAYMASGRGLGNTNTSLVDIFLYHSATNFLPGCKLILLVIFYCSIGGSFLMLLWPFVSGVCYLTAPVLYNPKPSFKALADSFEDFKRWITTPCQIFEATSYNKINSCPDQLDDVTKEQIFGVDEKSEGVDARIKFVDDFMKKAKGSAEVGMKSSLQTYWTWMWLEALDSTDGTYNDLNLNKIFIGFIWPRLVSSPGLEISFDALDYQWKKQGYIACFGYLANFLQPYHRMGMIQLWPDTKNPTTIRRNIAGPDASILEHRLHARKTSPTYDLLSGLVSRTVKYAFWFCLPMYTYLQRHQYHPHDYIHELSWWGVGTAGYIVLYLWLRAVCPPIPIATMAHRGIGLLVWLILIIPVVFDINRLAQTVTWVLIICVFAAYLNELYLQWQSYIIRLTLPFFEHRSFARLGFVHKASKGPGCGLYKMFFTLVAVYLTLVHGILATLSYFHSFWMFNKRVAQRARKDDMDAGFF
uniref:GH16 domain-containing protein n=1 Tax=Eutreptiella gymnastica TaxID=73025 RepID=A0A7S1JEU0_9EUGL